MIELKSNYKDRKYELFLLLLEIKQNELHTTEINPILKGATYLLLYNLIEATVRDIIRVTNESILEQNLSFDALNDELKGFLIYCYTKSLTNKNSDDYHEDGEKKIKDKILKMFKKKSNGNTLHEQVFNHSLKKTNNLPSIDFKKIIEFSKYYGMALDKKMNITDKISNSFLDVKNKRHDLSHGHKSFYEIGKNKSFRDLKLEAKNIIFPLNKIVVVFNDYIINKDYKA